MTSRPPMGVPQRQPPQRSLSGSSSLSQRSAHQRTISSSHHLPPSPIRKETFLGDFADNQGNNVAHSHYGTPRRGGSRLRLELTTEPITSPNITDSPSALPSAELYTPSHGEPSPQTPHKGSHMANDESATFPFPNRRMRFALPDSRKKAASPAPAPPKRDTRPKPYSLEVPAAAPRYLTYSSSKADSQSRSSSGSHANTPGTGYADFHPWTGDHPEDRFSAHVIQNGSFDKTPMGQVEASSAKSALYPMLKHKTGLHALSTIFSGILGHRRQSGLITSASTFKPPPRVTLTDTKREVWLRDLANPSISLRRLSRTIPHGIRGKTLLEQCLNKNVPTDRAVWLAKCVGANEIRAFKRKGMNGAMVMGGEAKWIRDWTIFVEQFVDTVVSSFGDSEWKAKVNYAVRLATHLYAEFLVDRDHYLDWLVSGLENSPQSKLPMSLLITKIYWKDLLRLRKYGRRLVTALLHHLSTIQNDPDGDILAPLSSKLLLLAKSLLATNPESFIAPGMWFKYKEVLHSLLPQEDDSARTSFQWINTRNELLVSSGARAQPAVRHVLVKLLDGTLHSPILDDFPAKCWKVAQDQTTLVKILLDWCTSLYRPGAAKVYVAHRLLASWSNLGLDVTAALLDFLDADSMQELDCKTVFYHLVSELVRSEHFHAPRYIQWLIARGGVYNPADVERDGPASTRLLVELPISILSESLRSMRANMLGRVSYDVEYEAMDNEMAVNCARCTLGLPLTAGEAERQGKALPIEKLSQRINLSSRALKTQVCAWIRQTFIHDINQAQKGKEALDIISTTFASVRSILEAGEDFTTLAEYLRFITRVSDVEILSSCADTLNFQLPVFTALGSAKDLFEILMARLKIVVEEQGLAARPLLASLAMLAPRIPGFELLGLQLKQELARSDRSTAVDACSPVSDNMAVKLQDEEGELHEEIEKRLMNGTSMDRNAMNNLFGRVISKLHEWWMKGDDRQKAYSVLLARLRLFDAHHFDVLMTKWVLQIRNSSNRPGISQLFPLLVIMGCLNLSAILGTTGDTHFSARPNQPSSAQFARGAGSNSSRYAQEVLEVMLVPPSTKGILTPEESYRFRILQSQAPKSNLNEMLALVCNAVTEYVACQERGQTQGLPLANEVTRSRLVNLLRALVVTDPGATSKALSTKASDVNVGKFFDDITTKLLLPAAPNGTQVTFDQILGLANDLTLPFCQLKLSRGLGSSDTSSSDAQERMQYHVDLFAKAMDNAIEAKNVTWTGILPCLSPEITQHLKNRAQARLFGLVPSLKGAETIESASEQNNISTAENLVSVIDAIVRGGSMGRPPQLVPSMIDKLADLWEILSLGDVSGKAAVLKYWLPLLLCFLTLHTATFDNSKPSNEVRGKALLVLSGLLQELDLLASLPFTDSTIPRHQPAVLSRRVYDLALVLVDNLSDESRHQCIRALRDATSDPRLRYIFSFVASPSENLMLAHKDRPTAGFASAGAGTLQGSQSSQPGGSQTTPSSSHLLQQRPRGTGFLGVNSNAWQWQTSHLQTERLSTFAFRRWEILNEPTPNVGENDTSLSLTLFNAIKLH